MKVVHPGLGCEAGVAKPTSPMPEPRMNIHKNARLTPQGRLLMVLRIEDEGWKVADAAVAAGLSQRRAYHWLARYRAGGEIALQDRSSTPGRYRERAPSERDGEIERLRRQRLTGDRIARQLGLPRSTVVRSRRVEQLNQPTACSPSATSLHKRRAARRAETPRRPASRSRGYSPPGCHRGRRHRIDPGAGTIGRHRRPGIAVGRHRHGLDPQFLGHHTASASPRALNDPVGNRPSP